MSKEAKTVLAIGLGCIAGAMIGPWLAKGTFVYLNWVAGL